MAIAPSIADAKRFGLAMTPVVNELLTTRTICEHVRKLINENAASIIAANTFRYHTQWNKYRINLPADRIIRDLKDDHMMSDEDAERYYSLRADFVEQSGWIVPERGYCPACMAEHRCLQLEWRLLEAMAELMKDERLKHVNGEHRKQCLDLIIDMVVNLSTYQKPTMPTEWLGRPL